MKKLLCSGGTLFSLLIAQSASGIIFARQLWYGVDNPKKTVEILFDIHAEDTFKQDYPGLWYSNKIESCAIQQRKDILNHALGYGQKIHMWIEDINSSPALQLYFLVFKDALKGSVLGGLSEECKKKKIAYSNLEFRDQSTYEGIEKEVEAYHDGPLLTEYYAALDRATKDSNEHERASSYLFNARLVHKVATCQAQHQLVVVGGLHGDALATALPLMGYSLATNTSMHEDIQKVIHSAESTLELVVQQELDLIIGPKNLSEFCTAVHINAVGEAPEDSNWTNVFLATHPLNIRAVIHREHKEAAAVKPCSVSTPLQAPVVAVPALRLATAHLRSCL